MPEESYDYSNRQGVYPISWDDFHAICKGLAQAVSAFDPEIILPVGRGGYYPGTLIAHLLRVEVYPIRLTRRVKDTPTFSKPRWLVRPPRLVKGRRVLVVDEISSSGETLDLVRNKVAALGAAEVRGAVLYAHSWGAEVPDYIGLISDALILNPWDREIFYEGEFHPHPEYVEALVKQGLSPRDDLLTCPDAIHIAKAGK